MTRRPGLFANLPEDSTTDGHAEPGFGPQAVIDPPVFDAVWGTLGAPGRDDGWQIRNDLDDDGVVIDVEILGAGLHVAGRIRIGRFDRLSDWINMQSGFIAVHGAGRVRPHETGARESDQEAGILWVRLDQIVMVAQRSPVVANRPGAPAVEKQQRSVRIVASDYDLRGDVHLHADGSMSHFLSLPDPRFLPVTDLTVRWGPGATLVTRFAFAMVNRERMLTVFDESDAPAGELAGAEPRSQGVAIR